MDISLKLSERTAQGKQVKKLRADGQVPSVVYGGKAEPIHTQSPIVDTTKVVNKAGKHSPVHLTIDGKKQLAIIKTIDVDPVKHRVRHVAFHAINQNEVITTEVPIHLVGIGESPAEKAGLVVLQALEHIEIKAKPASLPEALEVSIAELATDEDKLTLADIKLPEGVEFNDIEQNLEIVVANVYEPSALQAQNEAAAGDAEEPVAAEEGAEGAAAEGEASAAGSEEAKTE
jgi:large subunit ribosomal protein L25